MAPVAYRWTPIEDLPADTSGLEATDLRALGPLWDEQRTRLQASNTLAGFNERFNRRWAIETGLIERLYQFDRGITELLIEQGLDAALIPHGASDRSSEHVARVITDQFDALQFVFDFVNQGRALTTGYINQLHALLTANQMSTEAVTPDGTRVDIPLLRGAYKQQPNNPRRPDGEMHQFAPPAHVASEMDRLVELHAEHEARGIAPEVRAAWLHHAFTQIHPYQDGNGRVARALASLVFLRAGLFPLLVTNEQRRVYIAALEAADLGDLRPLVGLFVRAQQGAFRSALSVADEVRGQERRVDALIAAMRDTIVQRDRDQRADWDRARTHAGALWSEARQRLIGVRASLDSSLAPLAPPGRPYTFFADSDDGVPDRALWHQIPIFEAANRFDYFANLGACARWVRLVADTATRSEFLISFHGLGQSFQGVVLATAVTYRRVQTGETDHAITEIELASDEPFQILYTDEPTALGDRFNLWLDATLVNALDAFRRGL